MAAEESVFFVREATVAELGRIPRRGSTPLFEHSVSGHPNDNVHEPVLNFDQAKTCFVFISHRWLRAANGPAGHPDDTLNRKCKMILAALRSLKNGPSAVVPEGFEFALWIDYSCLDQDSPGVALKLVRTMVDIMQCCDLVLTPVVDENHTDWDFPRPLPPGGWLQAYQAEEWIKYLSRAWCRVEMMVRVFDVCARVLASRRTPFLSSWPC